MGTHKTFRSVLSFSALIRASWGRGGFFMQKIKENVCVCRGERTLASFGVWQQSIKISASMKFWVVNDGSWAVIFNTRDIKKTKQNRAVDYQARKTKDSQSFVSHIICVSPFPEKLLGTRPPPKYFWRLKIAATKRTNQDLYAHILYIRIQSICILSLEMQDLSFIIHLMDASVSHFKALFLID